MVCWGLLLNQEAFRLLKRIDRGGTIHHHCDLKSDSMEDKKEYRWMNPSDLCYVEEHLVGRVEAVVYQAIHQSRAYDEESISVSGNGDMKNRKSLGIAYA